MKTKSKDKLIILAVLLVGTLIGIILLYGGKSGWFVSQTYVTNNEIVQPNPLASPTPLSSPIAPSTNSTNSSIPFWNFFLPTIDPVCVDSDSGQDYFTAGTCTTDNSSYNFDQCVGPQVKEYFCSSSGTSCRYTTQACVYGLACYSGQCEVLCEFITNPTKASDCEGHPTSDGGICAYWGGSCLSTFFE